jgi:hypothetical protein
MYDSGKIIMGLIIFAGLFLAPVWYNAIQGKAALNKPNLILPTKGNQYVCVTSTETMRTNHMIILNTWRTAVVRSGESKYVNENHQEFEMSLTNSCLKCHSNKSQFCDQCHNYVGVNPYCFDCHNEPKNSENK